MLCNQLHNHYYSYGGALLKKEILLGIDAGTESVRVGLFDIKGKELAFSNTEYTTFHEKSGWAEQDPREWWSCLIKSTRNALNKAGVTKDEIIGISLDTTCCSAVFCKKDGTPLRNSIIWMDIRASKEAEYITNSGDNALKYNGYGNVSAEWMPCKSLWVKKNQPEIYKNAEVVCEFTDWYTYRLTGRWTCSISAIAPRWYYNSLEGGWPVEFYNKIGLGDLLEKFPKDIPNLGECIGGLTKEAAEELGLNEGTPIGQGGVDAYIGMLGLGVVDSGKIAFITGSSHLILGLTDKIFHAKGVWGSYPDAVINGLGLIEGGQSSSGSMIKWFRSRFCKDLEIEAKKMGVSVYDLLTPKAKALTPGSNGLIVLDWFQGNRTPYTDPNLRGMIYGLSLNHDREHIFRAMMEGIAYGTENILNVFKQNGVAPSELFAAGGATNSDLFLQIHSDVSNMPINIPEVAQAPSLGSAILASIAAGVYKDVKEASQNMVRYNKRIEPNRENHEKYQEIFGQYKKAYEEFGDWLVETPKIINR